MTTIQEYQQQVQQARQSLAQSQAEAEKFNPKIFQTQQQLRQATMTSQTRVQESQRLREIAKQKVLGNIQTEQAKIEKYNQQLQDYLSSPAGIIQSAKESGYKPTIEMRSIRLPDGSRIERPVYVYDTQYGKIEDTSAYDEGVKSLYNQANQSYEQSLVKFNQDIEALKSQGYMPTDSSGNITANLFKIQQIKTPDNRFVKLEDWNNYVTNLKQEVKDIPQVVQDGIQSSAMIDTRTGKPLGEVKPAMSFFQRLKETFLPSGEKFGIGTLISSPTRALRLISEESGRQEDIRQQKSGDYYQSEAMVNFAKFVPEAYAYSTPVAPYLLISSGGEKYLTPIGREQITEMANYLKPLGDKTSKAIAWSIPAGEILLGGLGARGQFNNFLAGRKLSRFEQTPLEIQGYRFTGNKGALDIIQGVKDTGKEIYIARFQNPIYFGEDFGFTLEGGKGISYLYEKPASLGIPYQQAKLTATAFSSSGYGKTIDSIPRLIKFDNGFKMSRNLNEFQAGGGVINLKGLGQVEARLKKFTYDPEVFVKISKVKPTTFKQRTNFFGLSRSDEGFIDVLGTNAKKVRYNVANDKITLVSGRPEVFGKIKEITANDFNKINVNEFQAGESSLKGLTLESVKKTSGSASYYKDILETSMKANLKSPSLDIIKVPAVNVFFKGSNLASAVKSETKQRTSVLSVQTPAIREKLKEVLSLKLNQQSKEKTKQTPISVLGLSELSKSEQKLNSKLFLGQVSALGLREATRQRQIPHQVQASRSPQKPIHKVPPVIIPHTNLGLTTQGKVKSKKILGVKKTTGFDVITWKKGKKIMIARGLTLSSALDIGTKETLGSLRASFKAVPSNLPARNIKTRNEFARFGKFFSPSKKDPLRLVQSKYAKGSYRGRLTSRGERLGIKASKRIKNFKLF